MSTVLSVRIPDALAELFAESCEQRKVSKAIGVQTALQAWMTHQVVVPDTPPTRAPDVTPTEVLASGMTHVCSIGHTPGTRSPNAYCWCGRKTGTKLDG